MPTLFKRFPNAFRLLSVNITLAGTTVLTSVILARALDPEERGFLATIILWPMLLSHLALMGVHLQLGRLVNKASHQIGALYNHGLIAIFLSISATTAVWIIIDLTTPIWPVDENLDFYWVYLLLCASIIPFSAWNAFQIQLELGRGALLTYNFARISFAILHLVMVGVLWLAGLAEPLYFLACFAVAAALASLLSNVIIIATQATGRTLSYPENTDSSNALSLISTYRAAWPFAVSTATVSLMSMADRLLLSIFFDAQTMGLYVIAIAVTQLQGVINEAIAPLFYTRISRYAALQEADLGWLCTRTRQSVAINAGIALGLMLAAPTLLPMIFGSAYAGAMVFVATLVPAVAMRSAMRPFEEILKGGNKPLGQAATIAAMSIIFALGGAAAASLGSPKGVALALLLANTAGLVLVVRRVAIHTGLRAKQLLMPQPNDMVELTFEIARIFKRS